MSVSRRSLGLVTAALLLSCVFAQAQPGYPNKVVRIIVPSTAGGPPDQIARMVATKLSATMGQPVIVCKRTALIHI